MHFALCSHTGSDRIANKIHAVSDVSVWQLLDHTKTSVYRPHGSTLFSSILRDLLRCYLGQASIKKNLYVQLFLQTLMITEAARVCVIHLPGM